VEPDDVIRAFEKLAQDEAVSLPVDDAISGLAVYLANPAIDERSRQLLTRVGATLVRSAEE
jgi:hypothetical protein